MSVLGVADLVHPLSCAEFFSQVYGRESRLFAGSPDRFSHLFDWTSINYLLRDHQLESPRLRLMKDGAQVPHAAYEERVRSRRGPDRAWLRVAGVIEALEAGATLAIDDLQELHDPVADLAESLETELREAVHVNVYVSFGTRAGFRMHTDPHDVFALQITGRKEWCYSCNGGPGEVESVQTHVIMPGDCLYLPRGWKHSATPVGEPTVHLAFAVNSSRIGDFIEWLITQNHQVADLRRDLRPSSTTNENQQRLHDAALALTGLMTIEELERFFEMRDATSLARPRFSLPYPVAEWPTDDAVVQFVPTRGRLVLRDDGVELLVDRRKFFFSIEAHSLLELLLTRRPVAVSALQKAIITDDGKRATKALTLVRSLLNLGLLTVVQD